MGRHRPAHSGWVGKPATSHKHAPDWSCGGCGFENWGWRRVCFSCAGYGKSGRAGSGKAKASGAGSRATSASSADEREALLAALASAKPELADQCREALETLLPAATGSGKVSSQLTKNSRQLVRHQQTLQKLQDELKELESQLLLKQEAIAKKREAIAVKEEAIEASQNHQTELRVAAEQGQASAIFLAAFPEFDRQALATAPGLRAAEQYHAFTQQLVDIQAAFHQKVKAESSEASDGPEGPPQIVEVSDDDLDSLHIDDECMEQIAAAVDGLDKEQARKLAKAFARMHTAKHSDGMVRVSAGKRKAAAAPPAKSAKK